MFAQADHYSSFRVPVWVQSVPPAVAFLRVALNNTPPHHLCLRPTSLHPPTTAKPPPSLSKWEESAKDGEEGCLFEQGAEHQTHFQMYKLFPSASAKKHFVFLLTWFIVASAQSARQHWTSFEAEEEDDDSEQFVFLDCPSVFAKVNIEW